MTELTVSPESKPEEAFQIFLTVTTDIISSAAVVKSTEPNFVKFSDTVAKLLNERSQKKVMKIELKERTVLPGDHIKRGEHAGVWATFSYEDGVSVGVNIHGGIRDTRSNAEFKDTNFNNKTGNIHADRSNDLAQKKTQFNLHIKDSDGIVTDIWIDNKPNGAIDLRVMKLREGKNDMDTMQNHGVDFVSFRKDQPGPYYSAFQKGLTETLTKFLSALR